MKQRKLGSQGPEVSAISPGCHGDVRPHGPSDREENIATIHAALDLGMNPIDTMTSTGWAATKC